MTFPTIAGTNTSDITTTGTSHTINLPASISSGDLLVVVFSVDGNPTVTWPTGWVELFAANTSGTSRGECRYRIADGTEGSSISLTTSVGEQSTAGAYRITGWHGTTVPEVGTTASGSDSSADPPSLSPSWGAEDTLWIAAIAFDQANRAITAWPTNYTLSQLNVLSGVQSAGFGMSGRQLNAATEDPGSYTYAGAAWIANTIAVRPAAGGGGISGSLSATLGAATGSATGELDIAGTVAATLGAATLAATAELDISGSADATLGALTVEATGELDIAGTVAATLGALTLAASGSHGTAIEGSLAATLGTLVLDADGDLLVSGQTTATLGALAAAAEGQLDIAGTAAVTLGELALDASGELALSGALTATLGSLVPTASGELDIAGSLAVTLGAATLVATGIAAEEVIQMYTASLKANPSPVASLDAGPSPTLGRKANPSPTKEALIG